MLQRTKEEQERYLYWHRKRSQQATPRRLLRESDELMYWLEECVERDMKIVPGWLLPRLVALLSKADAQIRTEMGRERRPLQVMEFLFRAQESLMADSVHNRRPAKVIPLFKRQPPPGSELLQIDDGAAAAPRA
jgi:hypothetical protein